MRPALYTFCNTLEQRCDSCSVVDDELPHLLNFGVGGPGRMGLSDLPGHKEMWAPLLDGSCGALLAMDLLKLDFLAMPSARLRSRAKLPTRTGLELFSKGGPSYGSAAWVWRSHLNSVITPREDIGSNCRLWISISEVLEYPLHAGCVAFPPFCKSGDNERQWLVEFNGLCEDIRILKAATPECGIILAGDWNGQPSFLSGVSDFSAMREKALSSFGTDCCLACLNPLLMRSVTHPLILPLRAKTVLIHPGSTRHDSVGEARAIDLTYSSHNLLVDFCLHNGVHCKGKGCSWDHCVEFCKGDHFLQQILIWTKGHLTSSSAGPHCHTGGAQKTDGMPAS